MQHIRMLIVEDDDTCRRLSEHLLSDMGYDPRLVTSGEEALFLLESNHYDVIWMDISLPGVTGLEVTKIIRATGLGVHIIGTSASVLKSDKESALAAGMNDYVTKPYLKVDLVAAMERYAKNV